MASGMETLPKTLKISTMARRDTRTLREGRLTRKSLRLYFADIIFSLTWKVFFTLCPPFGCVLWFYRFFYNIIILSEAGIVQRPTGFCYKSLKNKSSLHKNVQHCGKRLQNDGFSDIINHISLYILQQNYALHKRKKNCAYAAAKDIYTKRRWGKLRW